MSTVRKIILLLTLGLAVIVVMKANEPWKERLAEKIKQVAASRGLPIEELSIRSIGTHSAQIGMVMLKNGVTAEDISLQLESLQKPWRGTWSVGKLVVPPLAEQAQVPFMQLEGTFELSDAALALAAHAQGANDSLKADADAMVDLKNAPRSTLNLTSFRINYLGGVWHVEPFKAVWQADKPIRTRLRVENQPVDALLAAFGQPPVKATGTVAGTLPVTVNMQEGLVTFTDAQLKSSGPGTLALNPGTLPENGDQMTLVRDVLSDFRYSEMSVLVSGSAGWKNAVPEGKKLSIKLRLEGNNPAVYDGQLVKLNINLQGDIAKLIQQSMLPLIDPSRWLHKEVQ